MSADPVLALEDVGIAGARVYAHAASHSHRHNDIEINFVESGKLELMLAGSTYRLRRGGLYVFWAAIPHRVIRVEAGSVLNWVTLPLDKVLAWQLPEELTKSILSGELVMDLNPANSANEKIEFKRWLQDIGHGSKTELSAMMLELHARVLRMSVCNEPIQMEPRDAVKNEVVTTKSFKAQLIANYLCRHFQRTVRSKEAASEVGVHPNYAMNLFREYFGVSMMEFLARYRIVQAQKMLLLSARSIEEIAVSAGFGSSSQFYAAFKKYTGRSPCQYRKFYSNRD